MSPGSTLTVSSCIFTGNQATGSAGGSRANGGNGFGGGIYHDVQSTLTVTGSTVTSNSAIVGAAGSGGAVRQGERGGLYLAVGGVACLHTFTQAHTTNNQAKPITTTSSARSRPAEDHQAGRELGKRLVESQDFLSRGRDCRSSPLTILASPGQPLSLVPRRSQLRALTGPGMGKGPWASA